MTFLVAVLAAGALLAVGTPAAHAAGCASSHCVNQGGGVTVQVSVTFTGDAAGGGGGGGGSDVVYVKPICYWTPIETYGKPLQQVIHEQYPPGKGRLGINDYYWPNPPLRW